MKKLQIQKTIRRMAACMSAVAMMLFPVTANASTVSYDVHGDGTVSVPVVATYNGTRPGALIPTSIEFEGSVGHYTVFAFIDAAEVSSVDATLNIVPQNSFTMTKDGSFESVNATVVQDRTSFGQAELASGSDGTVTMIDNSQTREVTVKQAPGNGTITIDNMTKGTWRGTLMFTIKTDITETDKKAIGRHICECGWTVEVYEGYEIEAEDELNDHQDANGCTRWTSEIY